MSIDFFRNSITQWQFWKTYFTPDRYSHDAIPDLLGKVIIVTGANTGLGYATTVALAGHGAHVIMACRNEKRAMEAIQRAKQEIQDKYPEQPKEPHLEFMELDLNDMQKTRDAAQKFMESGRRLDVLICNAGIMMAPFEMSADGIENQFAVNYLSHFVFTNTLLPRLKESQPSRIVILSSIAHECTYPEGINFDHINSLDPSLFGSEFYRYGRAKLASILYAKALTRRLLEDKDAQEVYVNVAHPGFVKTDLSRHSEAVWGSVYARTMECFTAVCAMRPWRGSLTVLYAATSPEIEEKGLKGKYFIPVGNELLPSEFARDEDLQERLWSFSEELVHEKIGA
ncbi:hypothetical protein EDD11_002025 [Mortierella claussenii]|nr:hypothetical protein EDD11_002025 [Mortierella claussenii]